jgi:hypothetical protein
MNFFGWKFACYSEYWDDLLRENVNNVFYVLSRNVRCDLKNAIQICLLQKLFKTIRFRDHAWSFHRHFWLFNLISNEWRMLILDHRMTYARSRRVERFIWWNDSDRVISSNWEWFIKFDDDILLNLMRISSNFDERNLIKFWWRYFIKFDDISSNLMIFH